MKSRYAMLICVLAVLCLVQAGAALTYEGTITTTPSAVNALKPNDIVSEVSGTVKLPPSGDQTFADKDSLELYTQLNNAKWSVSIVVGGIENPPKTFGGHRATIDGWELSYPLSNYEEGVKVKFTLTDGVVPALAPSGDIILVRAQELDSSSNPVGASVTKNGTVINTEALKPQIDAMKAKLAELKASIDEKSDLGVDTTVAQQHYDAAKAALDSATIKLDTSPAEVNGLLTQAGTAGLEAMDALDQEWAAMTIQQADDMITSVNGLVTEFKVNDSLKETDPRLVPIINKYDLAARSLSDAKNSFDQKAYPAVRSDAAQSLGYANEAWNLSLSLKQEMGKGFALPGLPNLGAFLPILLVAVVILVIAGVIIYRRKMHWDELG
jgi:hypothetical protein